MLTLPVYTVLPASPPGPWRPFVVRETTHVTAPKPRLLNRVRAALRARHASRRTEEAYVAWIKRYIFFHAKRHPAELDAEEVTRFLSSLAVDGQVAASTQNALLRKYPNAGQEWAWQWIFPATRIYHDRVTGQRRRHHLHETVLQRAVKGRPPGGARQARQPPHAPALVRDASLGGWP